MRILIVEDEAPKSAHIERFLETRGISVVVARSVMSALEELDQQLPDLLLLDMSLPTFDVGGDESGGRPQAFGGWEILRQMVLAERTCPTIVVTGYEAFPGEAGKAVELSQMRAALTSEFRDFFYGLLHFNSTYDQWKVELDKALQEVGVTSEGKR